MNGKSECLSQLEFVICIHFFFEGGNKSKVGGASNQKHASSECVPACLDWPFDNQGSRNAD